MRPPSSSARAALGLAGLLTFTGTAHLVRPHTFDPALPDWLPGTKRAWALGSGVAELACAALVALPATRRFGGWATAALFVAVFPGNVHMVDHRARPRAPAPSPSPGSRSRSPWSSGPSGRRGRPLSPPRRTSVRLTTSEVVNPAEVRRGQRSRSTSAQLAAVGDGGDGEHRGPGADALGERVRGAEAEDVERAEPGRDGGAAAGEPGAAGVRAGGGEDHPAERAQAGLAGDGVAAEQPEGDERGGADLGGGSERHRPNLRRRVGRARSMEAVMEPVPPQPQLDRAERLRVVLERDGPTCVWCGRTFTAQVVATTDHLVPRVKGGPSWLENEVAACRRCNGERGHRGAAEWLEECLRRGPGRRTPSGSGACWRRCRRRSRGAAVSGGPGPTSRPRCGGCGAAGEDRAHGRTSHRGNRVHRVGRAERAAQGRAHASRRWSAASAPPSRSPRRARPPVQGDLTDSALARRAAARGRRRHPHRLARRRDEPGLRPGRHRGRRRGVRRHQQAVRAHQRAVDLRQRRGPDRGQPAEPAGPDRVAPVGRGRGARLRPRRLDRRARRGLRPRRRPART